MTLTNKQLEIFMVLEKASNLNVRGVELPSNTKKSDITAVKKYIGEMLSLAKQARIKDEVESFEKIKTVSENIIVY